MRTLIPALFGLFGLVVLASPVVAQEGVTPASPGTSPFDSIHIGDDGTVTVRVDGVEGRLIRIDGLAAHDLVDSARLRYGPRWKKRIAEDPTDAMEATTGRRPPATVRIVIDTDAGRREVEATFTHEKRQRIYGSDYGRSPPEARDDAESEALPDVVPRRGLGILELAAELMDTRWSYRHLRPDIDVRAELRRAFGAATEGQPPPASEMVAAMLRVLALFPDGHAHLGGWREHVAAQSLPHMTVWMGPDGGRGRVALMRMDADGVARPLDAARPYLIAIDGVPVERWLEAASAFEPKAHGGSGWHVAKMLRHVPLLRAHLGLEDSGTARVRLASAEGTDAVEVDLTLSRARSDDRPRPWLSGEGTEPFDAAVPRVRPGTPKEIIDALSKSHGGRRTLEGGVGYIRLTSMDDAPETITGLMESMDAFGDAPGLVIDVRGNGGGSRLPLLVLWRYLAPPGEMPRVVTLAKPLLGPDGRPQAGLGGSRFMYSADWPGWSQAERGAISAFADAFEPLWRPGDAFGPWHYFVLGGALNESQTAFLREPRHFDKPVAVLMDGDCFSATSIFLAALATRGNVTLVGTPASAGSGRTRSHDISDEPRLDLRLSTMASFQPDGELFDGNVIEPDIVLWPTLEDLAGRTDTQLDAALDAVAAKR